jgi:hypothetical protein
MSLIPGVVLLRLLTWHFATSSNNTKNDNSQGNARAIV